MREDGLVKIHIDLPHHWATSGEAMWATPLGNDLFLIENIPFHAYGLNFHDIVRATPDSSDQIPEIRELVQPGGHRTFRVFFHNHISRKKQEEVLDSLKDLTISYERANRIYFSLDMQPGGNYQAIFAALEELTEKNILEFETCEARKEGSFDDLYEDNK
ncbi:MAG: DUF4265 domain-containing protein [Bacteroidota bacterium]